jgi:insulysin
MKKLLLLIACTTAVFGEAAYERVEDKNTLKILTPALSDRRTAKIRLPNGLEAILISDPEVHQSAAALAVEAGSWQDPKEYPGMAHFLEHMLFMGTAAYPKEFEYMQYIHDHGGDVNAYTASDRTVYGFSIKNEAFAGALDRFSHFFIDPLFLPSCIGRELHAVDQEHGKNIEHDGWRSYMILKETGNPTHPNAGFSTGNAATLSGIPQQALKTWYKEHYSANRMHLVAISPLPLEEMVEMAVRRFSPVINHNLEKPVYPTEVFSEQQKGHMIYIKPVKDLKSLTLAWQLSEEVALDHDTRTSRLISYALDNGTENGLLEQLKREKIAEGLSVSVDRWSKESAIFLIDISLTEAGMKQLDTVILRTFQALNRLKETGIPRYIFDEQQKMATIRYEYQSRSDAFSFAMQQAAEMTFEKLETFPQKLNLAEKYDAELIRKTLNGLTPSSCVYLVVADPKLTGVTPTIQEKWMNASYAIKEITSSHLTAWAEAPFHPHIDIPSPNPFLPESLALIPVPENAAAAPVLVVQEALGKVYFQQDKKYQVPETAAIFSIKTPQMDGSAKAAVLFNLYIRALSEKLSTADFFASQAGLDTSLGLKDYNFTISVFGYSEKTHLCLKTLFQSLLEVSPTASEFDIYKESQLASYDNASKELPIRQSMQLLNSMIYNNSPSSIAKYATLKDLSYEEFLAFTHEVFKSAYIEGLVYGNLSSAEAENIWADLKTTLNAHPFPVAKHYKKGVLLPSDRTGPYMVVQNTQRQGNCVVLMLHEGPFSLERRAVQQILSSALHDDFYETLRTKQQTGYIAQAWDVESERQLLQFFAVQSMTHQPEELLARFELFLEDFSRNLDEKLSPERFDTLKASLVHDLLMPPETLPGKACQLHYLAFEHEGDFDWITKRVETVNAISYEQFSKTSRLFLSRDNLKRIAVLMEGVLPEKNQFRYEIISQEDVRGIGQYISAK